jgi:predicted RecB family nuclease
MQITNEILLSFLNCPYKAYRKWNSENGKLSDFEQVSAELTKFKKLLFVEKLSTENKLIRSLLTDTDSKVTNGVIVNQKFSNTNVELVLDGIEFIDKNRIIPILITPFEKITQTDKLFIALLSSYIQSEFNLNIESCKIIYGEYLYETNLKFSSFTKNIKRIIRELNKMVSNSFEPLLILNKHCSVCEFRATCKEKALADGNLSLMDRATSKTIEKYKKKGIFTIQQLSYIYKPRKRRNNAKVLFSHNLELQALALRTDKIYVNQLPELSKQSIQIFFDIEGVPDQESYYLIGVLINKNDKTICKSFWTDKTFDEAQIWQQFLSLLNDYPDDAPLYHYGNYESKAIEILGKRYNTNVVKLQNRLTNIVNSIYGKIYFPVYSNRLKELGNYLGFTWSSTDASGIQSLVWRYLWESSLNVKYKQLLITYNSEDCKALKLLTDKLMQIQESSSILPDIDFAINPKKISSHLGSQIHQELDIILRFAHENYDRSKINFSNIRTNEVFKIDSNKIGGKIGHKGVSRKIPKAKKEKIAPIKRVCTVCKSKLTKTSRKAERTITDLVFSNFSIRKTVIKYVGYKSYCPVCKKYFSPPQVEKIGLNHFGHNLKAWVVYQRLFLRLPFEIIKLNLMEMFNENISEGSISNIIKFCSLHYKFTENQNLKQILSSPFIHVDETQINVKGVNHYV